MNKSMFLGRLVKDPIIRYSQGEEPIAITNYTIAVNRKVKREAEPTADFINCIAFGKTAEFAEKYFKKGQQISIFARARVRCYEKDEKKYWITEFIVEEQFFADSKKTFTDLDKTVDETNILNEEDYFSDAGLFYDDLPF